MANLLILAAEGAEPTGLDLILPAVDELIWGTICFAVVAFFMMKYALPKIRESIAAREDAIQGAKVASDNERAEAQRLLDEYKAQLAEARSESNKIIEEARTSAEAVRKDLVAKAESDAQGVVARAHEQIEAEKTRTMQELQGQVASLAVQLAEKVVGRSLDKSSQTDLVNEYISQVGSMDGGKNN